MTRPASRRPLWIVTLDECDLSTTWTSFPSLEAAQDHLRSFSLRELTALNAQLHYLDPADPCCSF